MRENRTHGSEGGEAKAFPTPIAEAPEDWSRIGVVRSKSLQMQRFLGCGN